MGKSFRMNSASPPSSQNMCGKQMSFPPKKERRGFLLSPSHGQILLGLDCLISSSQPYFGPMAYRSLLGFMQLKTLRLRERKKFASDQRTSEWQRWDSNIKPWASPTRRHLPLSFHLSEWHTCSPGCQPACEVNVSVTWIPTGGIYHRFQRPAGALWSSQAY